MSTLNNEDFKAEKSSQINWVLSELLQGKEITPLDALHGCGCFRLAAVIHILRKEEGWPIVNVWNKDTRTKKRYAKYILPKKEQV